jgi:predicted RNA-binding protein YlqC (UPF0109 family)
MPRAMPELKDGPLAQLSWLIVLVFQSGKVYYRAECGGFMPRKPQSPKETIEKALTPGPFNPNPREEIYSYKLNVPKKRMHSKVGSVEVSQRGYGRVIGTDGRAIAAFRLQRLSAQKRGCKCKFEFNFEFTRQDATAIKTRYSLSRDCDGVISVKGRFNDSPYLVEVSGYGKLLRGTVSPRLPSGDRRILSSVAAAFEARASQHFDRGGCALAGVEVIVSALLLHPIGIAFGFVGILVSC